MSKLWNCGKISFTQFHDRSYLIIWFAFNAYAYILNRSIIIITVCAIKNVIVRYVLYTISQPQKHSQISNLCKYENIKVSFTKKKFPIQMQWRCSSCRLYYEPLIYYSNSPCCYHSISPFLLKYFELFLYIKWSNEEYLLTSPHLRV